ncbi:hypothetical protein IEZ26_03475 [Nocardioides cavernae]|uniref:Putative T7SS secretion signal domain-containing protein n=1 Tax=Nocardioides cavernae TaxID=1921566 RepID=A0ABR8N9X1_9ACTN|nr:hypothetical protein [Nocardioides cavernae]MBD3923669.1 hypothetical protein [Nocardioides cavernae]MBM7511399.1 hypothetical protein [Nocardioides cavernae]
MPDFVIEGNPGNVRAKALTMEQKGQLFYDTGDALAKIDVSGWTGRAADEFREAHDLEPDRWVKAGNGFKKAAASLTTYAGALEDAQRRAAEAKAEHERGERESASARTQYDSYLGRMRSYWSSGGTDQAEPFVDWGDPIQQEALGALNAARADLDNAASVCAGEVRAGCADAPEEPNWLESGLKFVGGIFEGAGEAVWDLLTMVPFSPVNMVIDSYKLATGDLTPEELMKKYELSAENAWSMAQGIYTGLTTDPVGFGKELGKSLLDWDTWADDPARAIGHLVPDAVAAVATGGAGAVATRGTKFAMDGLDALGDMGKLRHLDDLGDLNGLSRLDNARIYSMMDDVPHRTTFSPDQLGSSRVDGVLDSHGISRSELNDLINKPSADLTDAERATLNAVREDFPAPTSDTVMQKVIDQSYFDETKGPDVQPGDVDNYILDRYTSNEVRGAVTVADDTAHLGTPREINEGLRLDYDNTHHATSDTSTHVIRFQADNPNFEVPRNQDMTGSPTTYDDWKQPFTGNGFTSAADDVIPEYAVPRGDTVTIREGAEMWEVTDSGTQRLVAVLRTVDGEPSWIPQGN